MLFSGYMNFLLTTVIHVVIYRGTLTQKYLILVKTQCRTNRELREQQDREYQESLAQDQERVSS